jgi:hypothetical protein
MEDTALLSEAGILKFLSLVAGEEELKELWRGRVRVRVGVG